MPKKKKLETCGPPTGVMGVVTKPWFVLSIMVVCFGILTPKIFIPLFRQLLGFSSRTPPAHHANRADDFGPPDRSRFRPPPSPTPQASVEGDSMRPPGYGPRPGSYHHQGGSGGSSGRSFLNFLLPIYAVGIGVYMVYTLFKVSFYF